MDLNQCLSILSKANSDNEKMAAMLVAAKLIKSEEIDTNDRRKIFEAVGFNFLNRLLATKSTPGGCRENPYHSIAVTVLACFSTDQELALHPQITSKIPLFNEFICNCEENMSVAQDALQCLQGISSSCAGCRHLLRPDNSTLQALAKCYFSQTVVSEGAKDLILFVIGQPDVRAMESFHTQLTSFLTILAAEFRANQDDLKFQICHLLSKILCLCEDTLDPAAVGGAEWVVDVACGLRDILTSKLDSAHRDPALHLSALLCQMFSFEWMAAAGSRFSLLLVDLFRVESRLVIDGRELPEILNSSELLCASFAVFETTIAHMLKPTNLISEKGFLLSEEDRLHIHATLTESFTFILILLKQIESAVDLTKADFSLDSVSTDITPLLIACVRVVGAWLAEDSLSLSADVHSSLPFLVRLAKLTDSPTAEKEGKDLLKFLLPGLSHLTAEDTPRKILIEAGLWNVLQAHLQRLLLENSDNVEPVADKARLCCEVMVNVCVCEPMLIKECDEAGTAVALILKLFTSAPPSCPVLKMNSLLLFVLTANKISLDLLCRHTKAPLKETLMSILNYLVFSLNNNCPGIKRTGLGGQVAPTCWDDISELWYISMRELSRASSWRPNLIQAATEGNSVQQLTAVIAQIGERFKGNERLESVMTAICTFLQAVSQ